MGNDLTPADQSNQPSIAVPSLVGTFLYGTRARKEEQTQIEKHPHKEEKAQTD